MHSLQIYHRDLMPANFMIDGRGRLKIGDFGATCELKKLNVHKTGLYSPFFADLQARNKNFTPPSDVSSFGCCA
jgi:serine/threonine protein kinase